MAKRAAVILAPGFEEIEAVTAIDVLRRAGVEVSIVGLDGRQIVGAHGLTVQADIALAELNQTPDAVVLPGGMPGSENLGASAEVAKLVREVHARGGICAAICAAPAYALAAFDILRGRRATCYPGCENRFPPGVKRAPERVVVDGNIVTSQAPGTALEFSLALAELLAGKAKADALRASMLVAS